MMGMMRKMTGIIRIKKKRIGKGLYQCWGIFLLKKTSYPNFDNVKWIRRVFFNEGLNFILPILNFFDFSCNTFF